MNRFHYTLCIAATLALAVATPVRAQDHVDHADDDAATDRASMSHDMHGSMEDQHAVRAAVDALFDAMRGGDGAAVRAVFAEKGRLMSTGNRNGEPFVGETPLESFAGAVDNAAEGSWDERIWNVMIHVSGNLATAWTPYAFYHDGTLSHCGVNAFQLVRQSDGWKILQITDTRQREGCEIPAEVRGNQ